MLGSLDFNTPEEPVDVRVYQFVLSVLLPALREVKINGPGNKLSNCH